MYSKNMQTYSEMTNITDKGYLLVPYTIRRALSLRPRQAVRLTVLKGGKLEVEPMMTLEQVFRIVKPSKAAIKRNYIQEETIRAHKLIAQNALSE